MVLWGRRANPGTKVAAPSAAPNSSGCEHGAGRSKARRPAQGLFERIHRQGADDAEGALRKIDHTGGPVYEREPQRDDCEDAALEQPADDDRGHCSVFPSVGTVYLPSGVPVGSLTSSQV